MSIRGRWTKHRHALRKRRKENIVLQRAWDKYGEDAFEFRVIEKCPPCDCIAREQFYIDSMRACEKGIGYNVARFASRKPLGLHVSQDVRDRIAKAHVGKKLSAETKAMIGAASRGRPRPSFLIERLHEGTRRYIENGGGAEISARNRARNPELLNRIFDAANTPEAKASRKSKAKARFASDPSVARKLVAARWAGGARERMSMIMSGRVKTPEHQAKITAALKNRGPASEATREKMRASRNRFVMMQSLKAQAA